MDRSGSPADRAIFLPVEVLSALFRRLFLEMLVAAHAAGRLQFFGDHVRLADKAAFDAYLTPLRKIDWVVYAKEPFAGPEQVLRYLSRYTHRVAISNRRLLSADENGVTFKYKDYRIEGPARYKTMTLATDEFIRRFLIHVLPKGFHRIRHYGLLASGNRAANIARARELLAVPSPRNEPETVRGHHDRRAARAAASMSVLRWPHDHHRDLRARLPAHAPAHTRIARDQDRYLMTPSPPIDDRSDTRHSRWLVASNDRARNAFARFAACSLHQSWRRPCSRPLLRRVLTQALPANRSPLPLRADLLHPHAAAKSP